MAESTLAVKWLLKAGVLAVVVAGFGDKEPLSFAQEGVATPSGTSTINIPTACTVEPIQLPLFSGTPAASLPGDAAAAWVPAPQPGEVPPSDEDLRGVNDTILESIACENVQDYRRQYALFTDRLVRELIGDAAGLDPAAFLAGTPKASDGGIKVGLMELRDARQLHDDAIRVTVVYGSFDGTRLMSQYEAQLVLVEEDGRWLIDGVALSR